MKTKMKTTLLLLLFFIAHAGAQGETDLKCSQRTEAELGKDVTLDCYCEPRCHVTSEELKWKFNQKTNVLFYVGTHDTKHQDAQFKGRAQVSSTERLNDGNFPVTISKVRKSDEGTYTCHVGRKTCSVELKAQEFELKYPKKTVEALVGQNVTLNCKSEPQLDLTEEIITWKFNSTIFFDVIDGKKTLYKQFRGRVHLVNDWKVSEGKLSVKISSLNENDTGVYTCSVFNGPKCTVTLTVIGKSTENTGAQGDNIPTTSGDSNNCTGTGIGAFIVGVVVGAALTWLIYRYRRTQRGGERDDRRPSRDNQEDVPLQAENQLPAIQLQPLNPTQNQGGSSSEADPLNERSPNAGE